MSDRRRLRRSARGVEGHGAEIDETLQHRRDVVRGEPRDEAELALVDEPVDARKKERLGRLERQRLQVDAGREAGHTGHDLGSADRGEDAAETVSTCRQSTGARKSRVEFRSWREESEPGRGPGLDASTQLSREMRRQGLLARRPAALDPASRSA